MAVIDSDAHVLETERTWAYMLESECALRPRIVATPEDESSGGESWFVDGVYVGKARNVGHDTSKESREMEDLEARLKHMDELGVDIQVLCVPIPSGRTWNWPSLAAIIAGSWTFGSTPRSGCVG